MVVISSLETMDKISIKTPKPKCRLYWCFIELIDWGMGIQSVMLVFSTALVN